MLSEFAKGDSVPAVFGNVPVLSDWLSSLGPPIVRGSLVAKGQLRNKNSLTDCEHSTKKTKPFCAKVLYCVVLRIEILCPSRCV